MCVRECVRACVQVSQANTPPGSLPLKRRQEASGGMGAGVGFGGRGSGRGLLEESSGDTIQAFWISKASDAPRGAKRNVRRRRYGQEDNGNAEACPVRLFASLRGRGEGGGGGTRETGHTESASRNLLNSRVIRVHRPPVCCRLSCLVRCATSAEG